MSEAPSDPTRPDQAPVGAGRQGPSRADGLVDVVIMAKEFARAKTRLSQVPDSLRSELTAAMLRDTLVAVRTSAADIVVVSGEPRIADLLVRWGLSEVVTVADPGHGLNAAVTAADRVLGPAPFRRARLAVVADLPCLRADEFSAIAQASSRNPISCVVDADGTGTTILGARVGPLDPRFGPDSAGQHRAAGAVPLEGDWPGARRDVDTPADIATARQLGVGQATDEVLAAVEQFLNSPDTPRSEDTRSEDTRGARIAPGPSMCA